MGKNENINLKKNAILNSIKQVCATFFPLISFVYCSRILGPELLGVYSFGQSIISYCLLISCLGIPTYAVREGVAYKNNIGQMKEFVNEVFTISCITTIFAYIGLFTYMLLSKNVDEKVIIIQSLQIILITLGADWINSVYEDYFYLTVRYVALQAVSLVLLFFFVNDKDDLYIYTLISVLANAGGNLFNFWYLRKKGIKRKFIINKKWKKHIYPIFILFFNNIASVIYLNSDITMLGILLDNTQVGVYTASSRIYTAIKGIINAIIMVTVPRFSMYISSNNMEDFKKELDKIFDFLLVLIFPSAIGMFMEADKIILCSAGKDYLTGISIIHILSISMVFAVLACFFSYSVLLPSKKETSFMIATITAAILNIILNLFIIPKYGINGAALSTLLAEIVVFFISYVSSQKIIKFSINKKNLLSIIIACAIELLVCYSIDFLTWNVYFSLFFDIILGGGAYFLTLFFVRKIQNKQK